MTVTIPTVDDFADTTVMRVIRKIVDYIRTDLVPSINDNDIERVDCTLSGQTLTFRLYKGDNSTITDTVSLFTFVTSSELASELADYATESALADLQEQVTAISPQLSIRGNTLTVTVNGDSSSVTLPTGEANPYPTSVDLSVSGNNLSINIPMSEGSALKDTVALPQSGSSDITTYVEDITYEGGDNFIMWVAGKKESADNNIGVNFDSNGNNFRIQATSYSSADPTITANIPIISSVSGSVSDNNLTIGVNGVNSSPIALPSSGAKKLVTSGDITQFINISENTVTINKEFDIEYIDTRPLQYDLPNGYISRTTVSKGVYTYNTLSNGAGIGVVFSGYSSNTNYFSAITIRESGINVRVDNFTASISYDENISFSGNKYYYRLYA